MKRWKDMMMLAALASIANVAFAPDPKAKKRDPDRDAARIAAAEAKRARKAAKRKRVP